MLNARASCEFGRFLKVVLSASRDSLPKLSKDKCELLWKQFSFPVFIVRKFGSRFIIGYDECIVAMCKQ